jgi:putative heme-binding domain-containing protein
LEHANGWHRDTAARLLYERQDPAAINPLRSILEESEFPQGRLHALYALDGMSALRASDVLRALSDSHPRVREHAVRIAEQFAPRADDVRHKLIALVDDPDIRVRFQLAFSFGALPPAQRDPALLTLLRRDGAESWFRVALQSSLAHGAGAFASVLLENVELRDSAYGQEFLVALAQQIGRGNQRDEVRTLLTAIDEIESESGSTAALVTSLVRALLADGTNLDSSDLMELSRGRVRQTVAQLLVTARSIALASDSPPESRVEAITTLGCGSFAAERITFDELLAAQEPQPVQQAVLKTLTRYSDAAVAELLISKWPNFTPALRASAVEVLLSRAAWAELFLRAVEKNEIPRGDFDPARIAVLEAHPSPGIRQRAATVFSTASIARRADVVARYRNSLELTGDAQRGREMFQKSCASCHKLDGAGVAIGPDLRAVLDRGAETLLLNILDPNQEIRPNFLTYLVVTADGRALTGMITEETPNNITIRQADGTTVSVSRTDIAEMESTGLSYMPEGLENNFDQRAMADLLAYLTSNVGGESQAGGGD